MADNDNSDDDVLLTELASQNAAAKPSKPKKRLRAHKWSSKPSGAGTLIPDLWTRVFDYVDDSLDDLERVKTVARVIICSNTLKTRLESCPRFWAPVLRRAAAVAPCVQVELDRAAQPPARALRHDKRLAGQPWVALRVLNRACVQCRDRFGETHPDFGVVICSDCCVKGWRCIDWTGDKYSCTGRYGLIPTSKAKGEYRVTDGDLRSLPYTTRKWYGRDSKLYLVRHVEAVQARRYDSKAAFDAANAARKPFNPGYMSGEFYHWRIMGFESRAACEAHYGNDSA